MQLGEKVYEHLPEDSILRGLERAELDELLKFASTKSVTVGQSLFEQGDPGDSMMIVLSGQLKVHVTSAQGKEVVLDYLGPGGIIGEVAVLDGGERAASAVATEPTEVVVCQRRDVIPFLSDHLDVAIKVIEVLCRRLRRTNAMVEANATLPMAPKLARGLLLLSAEHGQIEPNGTRVSLKMSQSDLANYVALSRENVNRQLREWAEDGIVQMTRGRISVLDEEVLSEISEDFD